ncbi:MAG TPA: hypothetical protein PLS68_13090 [Actinotalea sp.]|nr:hypothetical protein [Actinotalea sp.]
MAKADREGLSLGYRIMWRIKYAGLHVFGPAQLGTEADPQARLVRQREARVAAARAARAEHEARG